MKLIAPIGGRARARRRLILPFPLTSSCFAVACVLAAAVAGAHEIPVPKADHLRVGPMTLRLEVRYDLPAGLFSQELRARYDRDHNLALEDAERAALGDYLRLAATAFLKVRLDGAELALAPKERRVAPLDSPLPSDRDIHATFVLEARLPPWPAGSVRRLTLEDRHKDSRYPVAVSVGAEGGCRLVSAWVENAGARRRLELPRPTDEPVLRGVLVRGGERLELQVVRPR